MTNATRPAAAAPAGRHYADDSAHVSTAEADTGRGQLRSFSVVRQQPHRSATHHYWTGQSWQLGTAAFWEAAVTEAPEPLSYKLGATLAEEVGACLLGGYGMPFQLADAAFQRLRDAGVFDLTASWTPEAIEGLLLAPLAVNGRRRRYRFPRQRGNRIAQALDVLGTVEEPDDDCELRSFLLSIPGIGPKTASWVVRNHRGSNQVAVIDIHLVRAGVVAGVFHRDWSLPRDYDLFEQAFLAWAQHGNLQARSLDAYIWGVLAYDPQAARDILGGPPAGPNLRPVWALA